MRPLDEVLRDWEAVIGLEVHFALTSLATKMFCDCRLSRDDPPNTNVCPVCLGLPGALPVPNRRAIECIVMAGLATGCEIQRRSLFYRKHYFYPDMSKNFQTTQGPVAFCMHGHLDLEVPRDFAAERIGDETPKDRDGSYATRIRIQRIHMEEDAAKLVHVGGDEGRISGASQTLVDYNRCGMPLIELVTEPDLRTPNEARLFVAKLRQTFLALGISDCSLEGGSVRCDGNVSIRRRGSEARGTKTELKNLNTLKGLHDALAYEICRQADVLEADGTVLQQTRHWEPSRRRTVLLRTKETAEDYRMYPDPDLAPFDLDDGFVERCRARMPELPDHKRLRYVAEFGIRKRDAALVSAEPALARLFEDAVRQSPSCAQTIANVVLNLVPTGEALSAFQVAGVAQLLAEDAITSAQAREVLQVVAGTDGDPARIVDERGVRQSGDAAALGEVVDEVLARCSDQVGQYRNGNTKVVGYLVGQCIKASQGSGNPKLFDRIIRERLA